jgi:hypothetical protein
MGSDRVDTYEPNLKEPDDRLPVLDEVGDALLDPDGSKKPPRGRGTRSTDGR